MRISKKIIAVALAVLMAVSMMPFTVFAEGEVTSAADFAAAVDTFNNGDSDMTITLGSDITLNETATVDTANGKTLTVTGKYTISAPATGSAFYVKHGSLTLQGGVTVSGTPNNYKLIYLTGSTNPEDANYSNLTVSSAKVNCTNGYAIMISANGGCAYGANITVTGQNSNVYGFYGALYVNGSIKGSTGDNIPTITVKNANSNKILSDPDEGTGLYGAGYAKYTISRGYFSAATGAYIKAGIVNITGGEFYGLREERAYVANSSGYEPTGEAIVIEANSGYAPVTSVSISGGTFDSKDADPIGTYANNSTVSEPGKFVSGGVYRVDGKATTVEEYYTDALAADIANGTKVVNSVGSIVNMSSIQATIERDGKTVYFSSMSAAVKEAQSGETIVLQKNWSVSNALDRNMEYPDGVTIDLNQKKVTGNFTDHVQIKISGGDVTFVNGEITDGIAVFNGADVTIGDGCTVTSKSFAVSGNHNESEGSNITILPGATVQTTSTTEPAIYFPQDAVLTISGGTVSGPTAVYAKTGVVNISGGNLIAIGADTDYAYSGNGCSATGDALVIESASKAYGDAPVVNITGGNFSSDNGSAVATYSTPDKTEEPEPTGFIAGGTFNTDVTNYLAEGAEYDSTTGEVTPQYVAAVGTQKFETLKDAIAYISDADTSKGYKANGTVTLIANAKGSGLKIASGSNLTIDFNSHTYEVTTPTVGSAGTETNAFQLLQGSNITFKDGAITSSTAKILLQNYSNLTLDNMNVSLNNPNYTGAYTLSNNCGTVVIDDTTITANPAGGYAFDVCRYASYSSVNVTVSGNSVINGDVEVYASNSDPKDGFSLTLESGTMTGDVVLDRTAVAVIDATPEKAEISKKATFDQAAPEGYVWETDSTTGDQTLVRETYTDGSSFTLSGGDIITNVYFDVDYPASYTAEVTYNHESNAAMVPSFSTDTIALSDMTKTADGYKFSIDQAPAQISEAISYVIKDAYGNEVNSGSFTAVQACEAGKAATDNADLIALYNAILDYGKAAQDYFDYDAGSIAAYNSDDVQTLAEIPSTGAHSDVTLTGISMVVTSDLGVNLYTDGAVTVNSVSGATGVTAEAGKNQGKDVIRVRGISSADLGNNITIVTDQGTIVISAYTAARSIVADPNASATLKDLARAVYLYGEAAADYFA